MHLLLEGCVSGVLDGLHAGSDGGGDVLGSVVEEEDVFWGSLEALGGVLVYLGLGFREIDGVRPGVVVEGFDPCVTGAETGFGAGVGGCRPSMQWCSIRARFPSVAPDCVIKTVVT